MRYRPTERKAFSLVELSIVLVILGLLTGGILAGQSLIRASELRGVSNEYQQWNAAIYAFRDKYFAVPGDMRNATKFWGDDNALCADAAITNGNPGTCNGDADGLIEPASTSNATGEMFQVWKQLALAGLISGSYDGKAGPAAAGDYDSTFSNSPRSRLSPGGWTLVYRSSMDPDIAQFLAIFFNRFDVNIMQFGSKTNPLGGSFVGKLLSPQEAWNIDTKMDDGKPGYGKINALVWDDCTNAANANDFVASYLLDNPSRDLCSLSFPIPF